MTKDTKYVAPTLQKSQVHDCTVHQNTVCVFCSIKKTHPLLLGKKHLAWKITSFLRDLLQKTYCLSTAKITEKTGKTRLKSQCQPLQIKLQVGAKHRKGIKSLLKTYFHKKGDPFWTLSRKDWNSLPSFFPGKYDNNQINNNVTQQPWKMEVFKMSIRKIKAKILLWKLLKTSFCAAHPAHTTKCTPLKPTQSQEYQQGKMH